MAATAASGLAPRLLCAQNLEAGTIAPATLDAYLDILLPGSEGTPSASALGVGAELRAEIEPGSLSERLIAAGTMFLDSVGPARFADLPPAARDEIVDWLAQADYNEIPGRFYHVTRLLAVGFYYIHPEALSDLPLEPAPQPVGYPPPWGDA
ncbi:hypothetical protein TP2_06760 [Thioclava pacifica DSM 10166]|uniref:Gluconate 2-dehydrogenase subunit 3 family protein n=2 Tax=Thioclava pacifica TaxID=285109 RepID=A0A074J7W4_9RHOB|nr:hypothetical protein TP2_06760 [Thioclava pacifica DSM 10166]